MRLGPGRDRGKIRDATKIREARDLESRISADVDAPKRLQIERNVEREPVIAGTASNAQTDTGQFGAVDIDTGGVAPPDGDDTEVGHVGDDRLFESNDEIAHAELFAAQVEQGVNHQLAWSVIRDLTAAIDGHNGNITGIEHMFAAGIEAERKHRRMLGEPDLIVGRRIAAVGKLLHRPPGRLISHESQPSNLRNGVHQPSRRMSNLALLRASARSAR